MHSGPWSRLAPDLGPALTDRLETTIAAVVEAVGQEVPAFAQAADPKLGRDLAGAARIAISRFTELIGTTAPALTPAVRDAYTRLGAAEARDGRGPEVLLASLRLSARLLLRSAVDALGATRPVGAAEVVDLSDALTVFVDELAAAGTEGYARQLRAQAGEVDRRRQRLAELLIRGGAPEPVVLAAAGAAGWAIPDRVVPVLLAADQARDARFRFSGDGLVVERGTDAVLLLPAGRRWDRTALSAALRPGSVVGPALAWPALPEALRLAEATRDLGGASDVAYADDVLAALALGGDAGARAVLADHRLAPLRALPDAERERLTETLRSWLRHWGSRPAVAAELYVHPQTVSYRVGRLRRLLGDALDDPDARWELYLALQGPGASPA